jgi:predicted dehydrogenase
MNDSTQHSTSRRDFLKNTGRFAATSVLAAGLTPRMYAGENNTIQIALVGCGGRGSGAADNALNVKRGPVKLVAMADVFESRLAGSYKNLEKAHGDKVDVPQDRRFLGFDAYKKAMDCLRPGDIAIFATPPAFRWVHFTYAIEKNLNVFMEKPVTVDAPTSRRMFGLAEKANAKNLKVGVGLMSRHSRALQELAKRIQDGELGDIILQRGYRMSGRSATASRKPENLSDLLWQVRTFHSWIWASGGLFSDYYIHIIDHLGWLKGSWPVQAHALGGRHYRGDSLDQNFDSYSVEYTYGDGTKFFMDGRCMTGCQQYYASYLHGSKGTAIGSKSGDCGLPSSICHGLDPTGGNMAWESRVPRDEQNPYQNEWNDLVDAVRDDKPYSEVKRGVEASLVTSMGRMAAHTGQVITYEQMLNCPHEMAPDVDKFTMDSPAPLRRNADGKFPVPEPGIVKDREYRESA